MRYSLWTFVALSPLVAHAYPSNLPRQEECDNDNDDAAASSSSSIITTGLPLSDVPSFAYAPIESLPTHTYSTDSLQETPTATVGMQLTEFPSFTAVPAESLPTVVYTTYSLTSSTTASQATPSAKRPSRPQKPNNVANDDMPLVAQPTHVAYEIGATTQCGNNDRLILPGMPWTVANSMYGASQMAGKQCTNFEGMYQSPDGVKQVQYTSITDVAFDEHTKDICKGYSNIGVGVNLNRRLADIKSIPAYFKWDRTNTTAFRGSNLFDFIVSPTSGDTTSTRSSEFMLWIRNWGKQVPIGYARGPVATLELFGARWKLYEGKNPASGVTVRSMLADKDYKGVFRGDLKQWLDAMVQKGYVSNQDLVTAGNAGTEIFYGSAVMHATVALDINV